MKNQFTVYWNKYRKRNLADYQTLLEMDFVKSWEINRSIEEAANQSFECAISLSCMDPGNSMVNSFVDKAAKIAKKFMGTKKYHYPAGYKYPFNLSIASRTIEYCNLVKNNQLQIDALQSAFDMAQAGFSKIKSKKDILTSSCAISVFHLAALTSKHTYCDNLICYIPKSNRELYLSMMVLSESPTKQNLESYYGNLYRSIKPSKIELIHMFELFLILEYYTRTSEHISYVDVIKRFS
jgi:hypothetical protein